MPCTFSCFTALPAQQHPLGSGGFSQGPGSPYRDALLVGLPLMPLQTGSSYCSAPVPLHALAKSPLFTIKLLLGFSLMIHHLEEWHQSPGELLPTSQKHPQKEFSSLSHTENVISQAFFLALKSGLRYLYHFGSLIFALIIFFFNQPCCSSPLMIIELVVAQ